MKLKYFIEKVLKESDQAEFVDFNLIVYPLNGQIYVSYDMNLAENAVSKIHFTIQKKV